MLEKLIGLLAVWIMSVISSMGYGGIVLLMAIESACIPLPSEIIMPFAGYLVYKSQMVLWIVAFMGALGCVLGSIPAYYISKTGGRNLAEKYGRFVLISKKDLKMADDWFKNYGEIIIFIGRLLPAVRTFIALPAGIARMNMTKFIIYTFVGSFIWCWTLAYIGMVFGEQWDTLKFYFHKFHYVIAAGIAIFIAWYIRRHFQNN
ncbi:MAG: DedA family protein [Betaproteobacteria bacterium]|nr:DedA family protein [Betaproteobacteria bacterium]